MAKKEPSRPIPYSCNGPLEPVIPADKEVPDSEEFSLSKGCCSDDGDI